MFGTQTPVVYRLRSMAIEGSAPSEMLREILSSHSQAELHPVLFYQYFAEAFCFSEGEASPLFGWRPDGSGELKDANIDYLMAKRIEQNRRAWENAPQS